MFLTRIPFTSSYDKESIPVTRKARRNSLIDGVKRPLLQRVVSRGQSTPLSTITDLTNSASTQAPGVLPTIQVEVNPTPLSTANRPSWPSNVAFLEKLERVHELAAKNGLCRICNESTHGRRITREELERDRPLFLNQSSASFLQSISAPQDPIFSDPERDEHEDMENMLLMVMLSPITGSRSCLDFRILTEPEKEKRRADLENLKSTPVDQGWTHSPPSAPQSRSPFPITIFSDLEREKREAHPLSPPRSRRTLFSTKKGNPEKDEREGLPRSTQRVMSTRNALAAALAPKRVPNIAITPIPILKAPGTPPQNPAQAPSLTPAAGPNPDAFKGSSYFLTSAPVPTSATSAANGSDVSSRITALRPTA